MYVCAYAWMYVCVHVSIYVLIQSSIHLSIDAFAYLPRHLCMYVRMCVCMQAIASDLSPSARTLMTDFFARELRTPRFARAMSQRDPSAASTGSRRADHNQVTYYFRFEIFVFKIDFSTD